MIKETNYGYACINMQLSQPVLYGGKPKKTEPITTNRTMIKSTFERRGLRYASELALQNVKDLYKILVCSSIVPAINIAPKRSAIKSSVFFI